MKTIERHLSLLVHALTGVVQGLVLWYSYSEWGTAIGPDRRVAGLFPHAGTINPYLACLCAFAVTAGLALQFAWTGKHRGRICLAAFSTGLLYALVALWVFLQLPGKDGLFRGDDARVFTYMLSSTASLYILIPYIQVFQENGRFSRPYPELFSHSWNNFFIASVALLFTGLYWGLIALWGSLFKLVGVDLFAEIFFTAPFSFITLPAAFGVGLKLGKESHAVISTLRNIALVIFKTLMPLLSIVALLFLFILPFTGLKPLWDTKKASFVTLNLLALTVLFINGVFQDGRSKPPYPALVRKGVEGMLLAMPAYAAITFYSIWLRVAQYGFTPERVYALVLVIIACLYSIGYAASVFLRKDDWIGLVRPVNMAVSLLIVLIGLLLHTPLLDPLSISATNQFNRLVNGKVDARDFDYRTLRSGLGRIGYSMLKELSEIKDHPQAELIRAEAKTALEAELYGYRGERPGEKQEEELKEEYLQVMTSSGRLPEGLIDSMRKNLRADTVSKCKRQKDCAVFSMNMDDDAFAECLFVPSDVFVEGIYLFDNDDGKKWCYVGKMGLDFHTWGADRKSLIEAARDSSLKAAPPKYMDLKNRDWVFKLGR